MKKNGTLIVGATQPCKDCRLPVKVICVVATGRWLVVEDFADDAERIRLHNCGGRR